MSTRSIPAILFLTLIFPSLFACTHPITRSIALSTQRAVDTEVVLTIREQLTPPTRAPLPAISPLVLDNTIPPPTMTPTPTLTETPAPTATPTFSPTPSPIPPTELSAGGSPIFPGAKVQFSHLLACKEVHMALFQVENGGEDAIESVRVVIEDLSDEGKLLGLSVSDFPFHPQGNPCPLGEEVLPAGGAAYIASPLGLQVPSGHIARAWTELCNQNKQQGRCTNHLVEFQIP